MKQTLWLLGLLVFLTVTGPYVHAELQETWPEAIIVPEDGIVKVLRSRDIFVTTTLSSRELKKESRPSVIRIGDMISLDETTVRIGAILCMLSSEDSFYGGKQYAWKDRWACVAAENQHAVMKIIESDDRGNLSWVSCDKCWPNKEEKNDFPWLMTSYKHTHLTLEQKKVYLIAYFETVGFILYNYFPQDPKGLNAWIDCVMQTKDSGKWSPEFGGLWILDEYRNKSVAYILYTGTSSVVCEGYSEKAGTQLKTLKIYNYDDWTNFSLKDKAVYLSGYVDTVVSFHMLLKAAGIKNEVRNLRIVIDAAGIDGILSDVLETQFDREHPLPWSISRGLGTTLERVFSDN